MRGEDIAVQVVDLLLDDAAGVVQDVQERLMLAVQIREKMLRALGQAQHRAQMAAAIEADDAAINAAL